MARFQGRSTVDVTDYGALGAAADHVAIQAAINDLPASGGHIRFPRGEYTLGSPVEFGSNVTFSGFGESTVVKTSYNGAAFINKTAGASNVTFRDMKFLGSMDPHGQNLLRTRTKSGNGIQFAVKVEGSLKPQGTFNVVENIAVVDCIAENIEFLPFLFEGVSGYAKMVGSTTINTHDVGYTYCESVTHSDNLHLVSSDNGVSVSRGCLRATVTGNTAMFCAHSGIWVAGFGVIAPDGDHGPDSFTVSGNTVTDCGHRGLDLQLGPIGGTVTGNTIRRISRGPSDVPTDDQGYGLLIGGYFGELEPTRGGGVITISGNTFDDCTKGGMIFAQVSDVVISGNLLRNIGSEFLVDGTTAVNPATSTNYNFGIRFSSGDPCERFTIVGNQFSETRGFSAQPIANSANCTDLLVRDNHAIGWGQALVETA